VGRILSGILALLLDQIDNPERTVIKEKEKKYNRDQTQQVPGPGAKIIIKGLHFGLAKEIHVIGIQNPIYGRNQGSITNNRHKSAPDRFQNRAIFEQNGRINHACDYQAVANKIIEKVDMGKAIFNGRRYYRLQGPAKAPKISELIKKVTAVNQHDSGKNGGKIA